MSASSNGNITIGGLVHNCSDLDADLIGNLVQNSTANGTTKDGSIDLAVLLEQCNNVCQLAWGVSTSHIALCYCMILTLMRCSHLTPTYPESEL